MWPCGPPPIGYWNCMQNSSETDPQGSQPEHSDAQAPGSTQKTNPNKEIGDGDEIVEDS